MSSVSVSVRLGGSGMTMAPFCQPARTPVLRFAVSVHLKPKWLRNSKLTIQWGEEPHLNPLNFDFGVWCVGATAYALLPGHGSRGKLLRVCE